MDDRSNMRGYTPRPVQRPVAHVPHHARARREPAGEGPEAEAPAKKRRLKKPAANRKWLRYLIIVFFAGLIAWLAYGYITTKNQLEQQKNGTATGLTETQKLENKVGQLVQLPQGETPTIATVNNASKLKNQAFFANAQDGDKVLIYSKSGMAVLYRPSNNKIIDFQKVNLANSNQ